MSNEDLEVKKVANHWRRSEGVKEKIQAGKRIVSSTELAPLTHHFQEVEDPLNSQWSLHDRGEICQS